MIELDRLVNMGLRSPTSIASRLRVMSMRLLGARIGPRCRVDAVQWPRNPWDIELATGVALDRGVVLLAHGQRGESPRICIGANTYINRFSMLDATLSIKIGEDVMIGPHCYITDHDHGTAAGVPVRAQALIEAPVEIESNVWLGAHVIVTKGVTIGRDAVVAAGSIVTRSVPAGGRVAGIPARPMKRA